MSYIDGYALPLPKGNIEAYRAMAQIGGQVWMDHGAPAYKECIGDDLHSESDNGSFPRAASVQEGETVVFAFIVFKSREHRDEVNAKVYQDPRMQGCAAEPMPFDMTRMIYGGFTALVDL